MIRVLVACEHSGTVRDAFRKRGHDAWSCDLLPDVNGSPFHFQCDVVELLKRERFTLMVGHPPCDYLTGSAEWAYGDGPYHQKVKPGTLTGAARRAAREDAAKFFLALYHAPVEFVAIENPVGCMSTRFRKPDQIIQPHEFGHDASKKTCLWLRGLPKLQETSYFPPRAVCRECGACKPAGDEAVLMFSKGCTGCGAEPARIAPRWSNQTDSGQNRLSPSDDRWQVRSLTYQGIAEAMANQWGSFKLRA